MESPTQGTLLHSKKLSCELRGVKDKARKQRATLARHDTHATSERARLPSFGSEKLNDRLGCTLDR